MRRVLGVLIVSLCLGSLHIQWAAAGCRAIDMPDIDYLYQFGTEKCSFNAPLFGSTNICRDSDNNTEAKFSNMLSVRRVPDSGWSTWSDVPDAESPTPMVGFNGTATLTITLADGYLASTAGVEIENNVFEPAMPITVVFRDLAGANLLTVTRSVLGRAGARLFAATCTEELINRMDITATPGAMGFGIAQVRADSFVINRDPGVGASDGPVKVPVPGKKSNAE